MLDYGPELLVRGSINPAQRPLFIRCLRLLRLGHDGGHADGDHARGESPYPKRIRQRPYQEMTSHSGRRPLQTRHQCCLSCTGGILAAKVLSYFLPNLKKPSLGAIRQIAW